jgi:hypothetical protein
MLLSARNGLCVLVDHQIFTPFKCPGCDRDGDGGLADMNAGTDRTLCWSVIVQVSSVIMGSS